MRSTTFTRPAMLVLVGFLWCASTVPVRAHGKHAAGQYHLTIGWGDEPAFAGVKNAVEVQVTDKNDKPVGDLKGTLAVEVSFGGERTTRPLQPVPNRPGAFRAWLVPTRAGTYAFRVTGTLNDQRVDVSSTCSSQTFDCVVDLAAVQFPVKDPSTGELADGLGRALPRADRALEVATGARGIGVAAVAVAGLALAIAVLFGLRRGRKGA